MENGVRGLFLGVSREQAGRGIAHPSARAPRFTSVVTCGGGCTGSARPLLSGSTCTPPSRILEGPSCTPVVRRVRKKDTSVNLFLVRNPTFFLFMSFFFKEEQFLFVCSRIFCLDLLVRSVYVHVLFSFPKLLILASFLFNLA